MPLAIKTTRRDELVENSIFDRGTIKAPNPSSVNSPALERQFRCGGGSKIPDLVFFLKPVAVRKIQGGLDTSVGIRLCVSF